jgi:hypothetical protein
MMVNLMMLVPWIVMPCVLVDRYNISEAHTISILGAEVSTSPHGVITKMIKPD